MGGPTDNDPFSQNLPARTPGALGHNDSADPNVYADAGPTPGPLGVNDYAVPASPPVTNAGSVAPEAVTGWPSDLTWSQFKEVARAPDGSKEDAQTATDQPALSGITVEHDKRGFHAGPFTFTLALVPADCWVVKGKQTRALLDHEQVHWDIAGLIANELSKEMKSLRTPSPAALGKAVEALAPKFAIKGQAMQDWYDAESEHGLKASGQKAWSDRVADCIKGHYTALPNPPRKYMDQAAKALGLGK